MKIELVLLDGSNRRVPLDEGAELTIGTSAQCSLRLNAVDVSRSHALLTAQPGKISLLDLGSTNGTYVNGRRIRETDLEPGDVVRFSSVIAQVMPMGSSGGIENPPSPDGATHVRPVSDHDSPSGEVPIILQDSVLWLMQRWAVAGGDALVSVVEWLVTQRGMRGAAVAERVGEDTVLRAAHGQLLDVLDDARLGGVLRTGTIPGGELETVQTRLGSHNVLAVHCAGLPCLLVIPGHAMPAASDLELYVALLRVAQRLDATATAPHRAARGAGSS
jgi:hypothetical protein